MLAGSAGTDSAGRVAYVKTVQPGSGGQAVSTPPVVVDRGITSRDIVYPASGSVRTSGGDSNVPSGPAAAWSGNDAGYEDSSTPVVKHMVISADINTDQVSQQWSVVNSGQWSVCHHCDFKSLARNFCQSTEGGLQQHYRKVSIASSAASKKSHAE